MAELNRQIAAGLSDRSRVEATDRVSVVQQVDLARAGITPDMRPDQVAARLASLALQADPPAGSGRVLETIAERRESITARADFGVGSLAARLERVQQRRL